ncbi:flippase [Cloacibacillus sp. An23]|uniref:flippase n=1 Tax=Cloacibacillus sp. An23 TaxID=1965591 RepID=UPI000B37586A|nr:flippase [Cloacibacillus sp. An23]OUO92926.1 hypothetical protein B5F39_08705 [Cloacibacillus sp. An23]
MQQTSLRKNAILNIVYRLSSIVFPLITYPYVSRVLTTENMGRISFFSSLSNYMLLIGSLGIYTYGVRIVAQARDSRRDLSIIVKELLILNSAVTGVTLAVLIFFVVFTEKFQNNMSLFVISCLQIAMAPLGIEWLYGGLEQYGYIARRAISLKIASLILIFIFVKDKNDYVIYATITCIGYIANYLCNFIHSMKFIDWNVNTKWQFKRHINSVLVLFASMLAINVYTNVNIIMLGIICGNRAVGLYDIASKGQLVLLSLINSVSSVLFPRLSYYLMTNDIKSYNAVLNESVSVILSIAIPIAAFFSLEARNIILVLGGEEYLPAANCMRILAPILIISGFSNITGNQILLPHGHDGAFMKAVSAGALVAIMLNLFFMPRYCFLGAAMVTLFAEFVQMSIQFIYSRKYLRNNVDLSEIIKIIYSTFLSIIPIFIMMFYFIYHPIINLIIHFCIFTILYILFAFRFKMIIIKELYARFSHMVN